MILGLVAFAACTPGPTLAGAAARLSDGAADVVIEGTTAYDQLGASVASAGDVDGDGYSDILVGAVGVGESTGAAYLYRGGATGPSTVPDTTITVDFLPEYQEVLGFSVDGAGDVDGDGYDDVIVGAPGYFTHPGQAFVVHGSAAGLASVPTTELEMADNADFGMSVSGAGDLDGDGYADVIVGDPGDFAKPGAAYVYYGSAAGIGASPDRVLGGIAPGDGFGRSVDAAGDVNGDGFADLVVGAPGADGGAGAAYVFYGSQAGIASAPDLAWHGALAPAGFGAVVAGAGDLDGDGYSDVVVESTDPTPYASGAFVHVFLGGPGGLPAAEDQVVATDMTGAVPAGAGDLTGDGIDDLAVAVPYTWDASFNEHNGYLLVYAGGPGGVDPTAPTWRIDGEQPQDHFGEALAAGGDVDGDGTADLLVGAPRYEVGGALEIGRVYVFAGDAAAHGGDDTADTGLEDTGPDDTDAPTDADADTDTDSDSDADSDADADADADAAPDTDADASADTGANGGKHGCDTSAATGSWLAAILALGAIRRRR